MSISLNRGSRQSSFVARTPGSRGMVRDFNAPAIWAALTTFIWYSVGMVPVQVAAAAHLGLDQSQVSSWIFIVWFSAAISSIALTTAYRQPLAITSSLPALVLLGSVANQFSYAELVGANLLAGVVVVTLGVLGLGRRLLVWLPMPVVMGMLGGSILNDVLRIVSTTTDDLVVGGATVAGYLAGRVWRNSKVPPIGLALIGGGTATFLAQRFTPAPVAWNLPLLIVPSIDFSFPAFLAVSLPLVVLSIGLGNAQGLGYLIEQGYKVPVDRVTFILGLNTIVNALFGGHIAQASRNGIPILASPEAGPVTGRYWGSLLVAAAMLLIALAAEPIASLLGILPRAYVVTLAGLALLASFQGALEKAFGSTLRFGGLLAFMIAATPFTAMGLSSAFWALPASMVGSLLIERGELFAYWREQRAADGERRRGPRRPSLIRPISAHRVAGNTYLPVDVTIGDLSANGLRVFSKQQLMAGTQLELAFRLPDDVAEIRLRVDVRHVTRSDSGSPTSWEAGCEFRDLDAQATAQIVELFPRRPAAAAPVVAHPASLKLSA